MGAGNDRDRWVVWLPVAFGAGSCLYFALPFEPPLWAGAWIVLAAAFLTWTQRGRLSWLAIAVGLLCVALGFTAAVLRTAWTAAPVLARPTGIIHMEGRVAAWESRETGARIVLDDINWPRLRHAGPLPSRVRIHIARGGESLREGQRIGALVSLMPPPAPLVPGGYDFARQAWYMGLGAVGFALGAPQILPTPAAETPWQRATGRLAELRHRLSERIRAATSGSPEAGAIAVALVTGERGPVPSNLLAAYRDSGLAHILAISGLHLSMVAGLVFCAVRLGLALIPWVALRFPIKKWAALAALLAIGAYLAVSGASVPTWRAFVMNGAVLLAVLLDREAISLRSLAWAALLVMVFAPEAVLGPSFQMSFAAALALIASYEALGPRLAAWRRESGGWWRTPVLYLLGILLTTQIAGTATALFSIYHFNRYASYSLLANILAVPLVGLWVMPAALLAFLLMPLGLDGWGWALMAAGVETIDRVALAVAALPGATINLPSMPDVALAAFTAGGLWLCLIHGRRRLWAVSGLALGLAVCLLHRPPDLLVDATGRVAALRDGAGTLRFLPGRVGRQSREAWAREAGQGLSHPVWPPGTDGLACDDLGCVWRADSHVIAVSERPEAAAEDCRRADIVIAARPARIPCPAAAVFLDGLALGRDGARAFWLDAGRVRMESVADRQGDRPWGLRARQRPFQPPHATDVVSKTISSGGSGRPAAPAP